MKLELRDLELLAALAKHRHFTRAAKECGISQPALSSRIRNVEAIFGMALVRRGSRFGGFTDEGEILLKWARRILDENDAMMQEMTNARGEVAGHITIGVIPTALQFAAHVAAQVGRRHPKLLVQIRGAAARAIEHGLIDGAFDIGISYLEDSLPARVAVHPLYRESYVLFLPEALAPSGVSTISWSEAGGFPLALLTADMTNRQIIDEAFAKVGRTFRPVFETNALSALFYYVTQTRCATIAPANAIEGWVRLDGLVSLPLIEPEVRRTIGAVTLDTDYVAPSVRAVLSVASAVAQSTA